VAARLRIAPVPDEPRGRSLLASVLCAPARTATPVDRDTPPPSPVRARPATPAVPGVTCPVGSALSSAHHPRPGPMPAAPGRPGPPTIPPHRSVCPLVEGAFVTPAFPLSGHKSALVPEGSRSLPLLVGSVKEK